MDLLCSAYAEPSDDEDETLNDHRVAKRHRSREHHAPAGDPSPSNRRHLHRPSLSDPAEPASLSTSRYISKRERAMLSTSSSSAASALDPPLASPWPAGTSPAADTIFSTDLLPNVLVKLRSRAPFHSQSSNITGKLSVSLTGHSKAVNSIQWSLNQAHLLASAGMDKKVHVWNVWSKDQKKACSLEHHNAAVKDVRWSPQGLSLLSCGYDCSTRLVDIEKGIQIQQFKDDQVVGVIRFHPSNPNLFLSGGSKGFLKLWDIRSGKVVQNYRKDLGPIFDIEFSSDGKQFISSSDTTLSNISENAIIVWDVSREVPLSNQVYTEAFTCPCIKYHPTDACFVAQSNGNYIAIFSSHRPFKLDRYKRFENHGVWGFPIKCNFSSDGNQLASGSSDGCIYLYNYHSSELIRKFKAFEQPCVDVAFHPSIPHLIASCSWDGGISIFE
ncbi:WD repeat-containing protein 25 [Dioscorea cayenensis subsp. rotundata]|uniref:WD repeat-containing protein 25 n=1 Tax=Dioscorea cayennensis subsp. rotundata TaxID=55577 RepID=A0AB40CF98_DIOCR|nr:WD repeat-containing protein 25 [Dioscorea cayenensis subsp. rotundata]